ncbi:MAG: polysaccharide deacetylase family protein [Gammaproteobacteria bacterium]|nr:polysaccharide deacetylase family protein [Gammaproteobacteria bacterium]
MIRKIKSRIVRFFCEFGGYKVAHKLTRNQPKIMMMHRFSEEPKAGYIDRKILRQQIAILKRDFNVIAFSELIKCLKNKENPPENSIVLTVDDGYMDMYSFAFEEFNRAGLPVTLFVTTGFIDGKCWLWPDRVSMLLKLASSDVEVNFFKENKILPSGLYSSWQAINNYLLPLSLTEKNHWIDQCAEKNNILLPKEVPDEYAPLTWTQIQELSESNVEIGAHTVNHPILSAERLSDVEFELVESKRRLESMINKAVSSFCYPNGQLDDFNSETEAMVEKANYQAAVMANCDCLSMDNPFALPRFAIGDDMYQFKKSVYGVQWIAKSFTT